MTDFAGSIRHLVTLENPGTPVPDGDGGFTSSWTALSPATWHCSIKPATARDLERVAAGTVVSAASHIVEGRYHSGVTTKTRITFGSRVLNVVGVSSPEERKITTVALCTEVVA